MKFSIQEFLIFAPEKLPLTFDFKLAQNEEEFVLLSVDMQSINAILCKHENSKGIILYFHGNKGSLRTWKDENKYLQKFGYDILMIDFRGYGKSTGSFTEKGFYLDAETAYDFAINQGYAPNQIVIYGRSLGTGIASALASRRTAKALILEAPYTNMLQMGKLKYPWLFPYIFLSFKFDTLGRAPLLKLPVLLIHGKNDKTIPYNHSEKIYSELRTDKQLLLLPEADHNSSSLFPEYFEAISSFI